MSTTVLAQDTTQPVSTVQPTPASISYSFWINASYFDVVGDYNHMMEDSFVYTVHSVLADYGLGVDSQGHTIMNLWTYPSSRAPLKIEVVVQMLPGYEVAIKGLLIGFSFCFLFNFYILCVA
jgi:hypothetical protein